MRETRTDQLKKTKVIVIDSWVDFTRYLINNYIGSILCIAKKQKSFSNGEMFGKMEAIALQLKKGMLFCFPMALKWVERKLSFE